MRAKKSGIAETKADGIPSPVSKPLESRERLKPYPSPVVSSEGTNPADTSRTI